MSKISLISLALLPTFLNPLLITNSYHQAENIKNQKSINYQAIDWKEVEKLMPSIIKKFLKENKDSNVQNILMNKINQIIFEAKNESLNLTQLINKISDQSSDFQYHYKQSQQKIFNLSFTPFNKVSSKSIQFSQAELDKLNKLVNDLKISKVTFTSVSAAAAIASAAFWATAWWFGATIPWAVGSSVASALAGGIASGISIALIKYDEELNKWKKSGGALTAIYSLGHIFYRILNPLLIGATATAAATSWAFPGILAIIPITGSILAWINLYK